MPERSHAERTQCTLSSRVQQYRREIHAAIYDGITIPRHAAWWIDQTNEERTNNPQLQNAQIVRKGNRINGIDVRNLPLGCTWSGHISSCT